jgi:multiple sugar transport system ATP-binding protein
VQTRSQIAGLQKELGITTVYVTHDQIEAMTMGHRVAVLLDGVLQQVATPRELYDKPSNVFVAGFMGSPAMNIKKVQLNENGAVFGSLILPLTREQMAAARAEGGDGSVVVGFRPEDTDLVSASEGGMPMEVELVEDLGAEANVYGHAQINGSLERFVVRTERRNMPSMGETVFVMPRVGQHHAFNAATEQRI